MRTQIWKVLWWNRNVRPIFVFFCIHRVKIQKKTNICVYRRDLNCSREYIVYTFYVHVPWKVLLHVYICIAYLCIFDCCTCGSTSAVCGTYIHYMYCTCMSCEYVTCFKPKNNELLCCIYICFVTSSTSEICLFVCLPW